MRSTVLNYGSLATIVHVTNPAVYDEKKILRLRQRRNCTVIVGS